MTLANLNKSTASNFELYFPKIPTGNTVKEMQSLTLNIHTTVIPSMTLETTQQNWLGGTYHMDVGGMTFEPWYVHFSVDSSFSNWISLYKWLTFINNNKDKFGTSFDRYKVDAVLRVLDNFRNEILVINLVGMWINMLGEISLTYREGNANLNATANFIYDRYEIRNI